MVFFFIIWIISDGMKPCEYKQVSVDNNNNFSVY